MDPTGWWLTEQIQVSATRPRIILNGHVGSVGVLDWENASFTTSRKATCTVPYMDIQKLAGRLPIRGYAVVR